MRWLSTTGLHEHVRAPNFSSVWRPIPGSRSIFRGTTAGAFRLTNTPRATSSSTVGSAECRLACRCDHQPAPRKIGAKAAVERWRRGKFFQNFL
ncbi:hypothetical protein RHEC894_PC00275 (plasmid) [Rhizobium sp. CIAT894]|nr:hypothetical protein RHEC894_PC00275 [Rhizobium sp. CIAT894]ARO26880.1 hypothetical protein TAL182_PC00273 [Rhizobium sp. TAL182]